MDSGPVEASIREQALVAQSYSAGIACDMVERGRETGP
jgi:hypothetical protein